MNKAGIWTTTWIAVVCAAGGARLMHNSNGFGGAGSDANEIAMAYRLGVPIDLSSVATTPIPPNQNAATVYQNISEVLVAEKKVQDTLQLVGLPMLAQKPSREEAENAKKERANADVALPKLQQVFKLAEKLDSYPKCDFGHSVDEHGNSMPSPLVSTARSFTLDLCVKADYQDRQGDWKGALQSMHLAHRVGLDAGTSPGFNGMFTQMGMRTVARKEYEVLIQRHSSDLPFLNAASMQIAAEGSLPDFRKFVIDSVLNARPEIKSIGSIKDLRNEIGAPNNVDDLITENLMSGQRLQQELDARLLTTWIDLWQKLPKDPTDWQAYRRILKQTSDRELRDVSSLNSLNQSEFSMLCSAADRVGEIQAYDRLLLDSIDLLKARIALGKFPTVLPKSLGADRIDPFDGNPMRYHPEGAGFTLYSIGMDGNDNGGNRSNPSDPPGTGVDLVETFS